MLCCHGADVNRHNPTGPSALALVLQCAQKRTLKTDGPNSKIQGSASQSGRNFWVPVARLLVKRGALWDLRLKDEHSRNQLLIMFNGPTPPRKDWDEFFEIIEAALHAGLDPAQVDANGDSLQSLVQKR